MTLGIAFFTGSLVCSIFMKRYEILPYSGIFSVCVILADLIIK